jgi:hypothetical protein
MTTIQQQRLWSVGTVACDTVLWCHTTRVWCTVFNTVLAAAVSSKLQIAASQLADSNTLVL